MQGLSIRTKLTVFAFCGLDIFNSSMTMVSQQTVLQTLTGLILFSQMLPGLSSRTVLETVKIIIPLTTNLTVQALRCSVMLSVSHILL